MKKPKPSKKAAGAVPANPTTASGLDLGAVRELALIAEEYGLAEIEADPSGYVRISRRLQEAATGTAQMGVGATSGGTSLLSSIALAPTAQPEIVAAPGTLVTSPFVGTFYRAPSPDASPFVEVGDAVKKGQVVCIVEAMKLMNEIEAEMDGRVAELVAKNGEHVEYGQTLIRLTPS